MVGSRFGYFAGDKKVHVFPDPRGEAVDCRVVGTELNRVKERGDPGVGLSILDGAEGLAECEFSKHCSCIRHWTNKK